MGGRVLELDRFPQSCQEAELALRMQKTAGGPERITLFDDPHVQIQGVSASPTPGGFTVTAQARIG